MVAIYTYFSNAFSTVDRSILLNQLRELGFKSVLLHWLLSFFIDQAESILLISRKLF